MRCVIVAVVACGCGRLGFDELAPPDDGPGSDVSLRPCGAATTAPDPVTISGSTFRFTSFDNNRAAVDTVTVEAFDDTDTLRGTTVSDAQGLYTLIIATGGVAPALRLRYSKGGFFTSTVHLDAPLDGDLPLGDSTVLNASDGPLWNGTAMASVYSAGGTTLMPAFGTLNISTYDCLGQPLSGVALTLDTQPEVAVYLGPDGMPDNSLTTTISPLTFLIGYNAPAQPTTITATATGRTFSPQTRLVRAGNENTLIRVRPDN